MKASLLDALTEDQLTEDMKFALAMSAGVPFDTSFDGEKCVMTTRVPVGFAKVNGRWVVCVQQPHAEREDYDRRRP